MAEVEASKARKLAKSKFTRSLNVLKQLIDVNSPPSLTDPQFQKMNECWEALEKAQDRFIEVTDSDIEEKGGLDYVDEPGDARTAILIAYSGWLKRSGEENQAAVKQKAEEDRLLEETQRKRRAIEAQEAEDAKAAAELVVKFESLKLEVESNVETFGRLTVSLLESLKDASDEVKQSEWIKVDSEFTLLKKKLCEVISLNAEEDLSLLKNKFKSTTVIPDLKSQKT